jgi:glutathione S-transferase
MARATPVLRQLDAQLDASGARFFGGETPGVGDFGLHATLDIIVTIAPTALDAETPRLRAWLEAMAALPGVDEYLASRPQLGARSLGNKGSLMSVGREGAHGASRCNAS